MNKEFQIMLKQCEKQAKKLAETQISPIFFNELDIFDNYFDQLKQIIENKTCNFHEDDLTNLRKYIDIFKEKLETEKCKTLQEAKNAGKNEKIRNYGLSSAHEGALKFDKRS